MDVLLSKALDKIEKIMERYSSLDFTNRKIDDDMNDIKNFINKILINEAKLDKTEFESAFGLDLTKKEGMRVYWSLSFPKIQFNKEYELGYLQR